MRPIHFLLPVLLFLIALTSNVLAQEQLGLRLDNYAGVNSVLLNPSLPVTSPYKWDVNLISFAGFLDNSYAYIENVSLLDMRRFGDIRPRPEILEDLENMPENPLILDYVSNKKKKWASGSISVMGPSMMLNLDSGWGFALFTQFRTVGQIRKVPVNLDYYRYDAVPRNEEISATPFKGAMMTWGEMGFNAAKKIDTWYGVMAVGGTLKMLGGFEAVFGSVNNDFNVTKRGTDTLQIANVNSEFGFTTSNADIYNNNNPMLGINGYGAGMDIGVQFIVGGSPEKYQWRAGAAIVDIGTIAFSRNAESYQIDKKEMFNLAFSNYENLTNPIDVVDVLSTEALGDSTAAFKKSRFNIWLPAALNLHADYAFTDNFYLGAAFIQRIPLGRHRVDRNNIIALAPRLECRWFGLVMPINVLNYEQVHLGLAARLGLLTIGTDNLGSYFEQSNFTGTDFYFALKVNPFKLKGSGSRRGKGQVRCYDF
ncbi:MAG: hypothetical protein ACI8YQ_002196 [Polaribacter sp.]|jgi:hypothetical protein